jgi:hypothetical protein
MGFLRSGLVFLLAILLFISFIALNSFLVFGSSLKYEKVQGSLYPIVKELSTGQGNILPKEVINNFNLTQVAEEHKDVINQYCQNATQYNFNYQGYNINISCSDLNLSEPLSAEKIINQTFDNVVHEVYYKQYDCDFWNCFSQESVPFFLISEKARAYWMGKFYLILIITLILILLLILAVEKKNNALIIIGVLLIISAFLILKLGDLIFFLAKDFSSLISLFLNSTKFVFILSLVIGIFLVASGIALKFWKYSSAKDGTKQETGEEKSKKKADKKK